MDDEIKLSLFTGRALVQGHAFVITCLFRPDREAARSKPLTRNDIVAPNSVLFMAINGPELS